MAELVDAAISNIAAARRAGSSPAQGTKLESQPNGWRWDPVGSGASLERGLDGSFPSLSAIMDRVRSGLRSGLQPQLARFDSEAILQMFPIGIISAYTAALK